MKRSKPVPTEYVTASEVRRIFGDISHTSLHRWLKDEEKGFPKPVYIGNRRYFKVEEIESFKIKIESRRN